MKPCIGCGGPRAPRAERCKSCYLAHVRATQYERVEARIDRSGGPDTCHPWTGHTSRGGYGSWKNNAVHRIVLAHKLGRPLAEGMYALHTCDNPPCGNAAHLFEGTHADNMRDMVRKGRGTVGERNPSARLTADQVRAMRALQGVPHRAIAARFGVSQSNVSRILSRDSWAGL